MNNVVIEFRRNNYNQFNVVSAESDMPKVNYLICQYRVSDTMDLVLSVLMLC